MSTDEVIHRALPQFFPEHWLDRSGMVFSDFASRIRVGYVIRGGGSYSYLCDKDLSAIAIPLEELHAAALENLARLPSAVITIGKVPGGAEGWIHATEDNFAAARYQVPGSRCSPGVCQLPDLNGCFQFHRPRGCSRHTGSEPMCSRMAVEDRMKRLHYCAAASGCDNRE